MSHTSIKKFKNLQMFCNPHNEGKGKVHGQTEPEQPPEQVDSRCLTVHTHLPRKDMHVRGQRDICSCVPKSVLTSFLWPAVQQAIREIKIFFFYLKKYENQTGTHNLMTWVQVSSLLLAFCFNMSKPLHPSGYRPLSCGMNEWEQALKVSCNSKHPVTILRVTFHPFLWDTLISFSLLHPLFH